MSSVALALHRAILCVDVEGFGDRRRTNLHQVAVRDGLYRSLRDAFTRSGVEWDACHREDRGDGILLLVHLTFQRTCSSGKCHDILPQLYTSTTLLMT